MDRIGNIDQLLELINAGRAEEAVEPLKSYLAANRDDQAMQMLLPMLLGGLGRHAEALDALATLEALRGQSLEFHACRGGTLAALGRWDEAFDEYIAQLRIDPRNAAAWSDAARTQADRPHQSGQHACFVKARDCLRKAVELEPANADFRFRLGCMCSNVGPLDEAVMHLREVVRLVPGHLAAHRMLGELLAHTDSLDSALPHLRQAVALGAGGGAKAELAEAEAEAAPAKGRRRVPFARYPSKDQLLNDFAGAVQGGVLGGYDTLPRFIGTSTRFFTLGSCFARHVAMALRNCGCTVDHIEIGEIINSTFANRALLEWALGRARPELAERIGSVAGEFTTAEALRETIRQADCVIFTMGLAACFFDTQTGEFVMPRPSFINARSLAEKYQSRMTTVQENSDNLAAIVALIREINPSARIVITLSPVPMNGVFNMPSAVQADCLSKSTLRVAVHEFLARAADTRIIYWPSFEIVRWLSGHVGRFYGTDDDYSVHVSEEVVAFIMSAFVDTFRETAAAG